MNTAAKSGALSADEWLLVNAIRDLPPSLMRERFLELLGELLRFVEEPRCAEVQADGAPCASVQVACDQCRRVTEVLDTLRTRLHPS